VSDTRQLVAESAVNPASIILGFGRALIQGTHALHV
jgi:hypothetical protein